MSLKQNKVNCNNCSLDNICFPRGLSLDEINTISQIIKPKKTLQRGEYIFREGDDFRGVLAIKSGTAKLISNDHHGNEHILNILLPGELLGFDGFCNDKYHYSAIALDTLSFCELPAKSMDDIFHNVPTLTRELFRHSSEKMNDDRNFFVLSKRPAEERLAHFLIGLSDRLQKRGFSASKFTLSLTRQEMGNHLGLALETVSRLLKKFQQENLISFKSKHIEILDIPRLRAIFSYTE
jgi:CRP/FNR family transcriptional regulator